MSDPGENGGNRDREGEAENGNVVFGASHIECKALNEN